MEKSGRCYERDNSKQRGKMVKAYLTEEEYKVLKEASDRYGMSVSNILRRLVRTRFGLSDF